MKPALTLVKPGPSFAMRRKALRMFNSEFASRETRHANARAWIAANERLGDRHILKKAIPRFAGAHVKEGGNDLSHR